MGNLNLSIFSLMTIIVPIFIVLVFIFVILSIFSPKVRAKMMGKQIKATKYMMDENKDNLTDIATTAGNVFVESSKNVFDRNENSLREMATKTANITKEGIETTARAIRKGLTEDEAYCKYCGEAIDKDSKFCKKCGRKQ